ncbi:DUF2971 domain-containing protein [Pelomonas sp. SE-A7]|uniref:DUF2971 domain-containing protein n=1 Tax=Pelomonas sp. SE-A7 TaxID=3054953 RepID=UPI00259C795B|nr:DUF2971 domain-containing protein [Pelomonas sp. SE-A7]MDM4766151.1 DUF2971 domain-containing protein [Pelomonas sp. SE-A7]
MEVFYFTTAQHAINNIALRRLKVSRYRELNDPFELQAMSFNTDGERDLFNESIEALHAEEGLVCFTEDWKNQLMWSHYADKYQGVALGFEVEDGRLDEIKYQKTFAVGDLTATSVEKLLGRLKTTKSDEWRYEKERRLFVTLADATKEGGLYFIPFLGAMRLTKVILGARCSIDPNTVHDLLKPFEGAVAIVQTKTATGGFDIVTVNWRRRLSHAFRGGIMRRS